MNKSSTIFFRMATWYLGISRVTFSVLLVVTDANTCIQTPAVLNMPSLVGSYGMADLAKVECN